MGIHQLRYFLAVADTKSFTRASEKVFIQPSPLSRAITDLESELGHTLLKRNKGCIQLTLEGKVFVEEAQRILKSVDDARLRIAAVNSERHAQIRIAFTGGLAHPKFTNLLARCQEEEPQTSIRFSQVTYDQMIKQLEQEDIDVGFTVHVQHGDELQSKLIWKDQLAVAMPKGHPLVSHEKIRLHDVIDYALITSDPNLCPRGYQAFVQLVQSICGPDSQPLKIKEYVSNHDSMIMLVAAGFGIGLGLKSHLDVYGAPNVIVRPLTDDVPLVETYLITRNETHSDVVSRFIQRTLLTGQLEQAE